MMQKAHDSRTAIYARVSSDQQAEEATIESQIAELERTTSKKKACLAPGGRILVSWTTGTLEKHYYVRLLERLGHVAYAGVLRSGLYSLARSIDKEVRLPSIACR